MTRAAATLWGACLALVVTGCDVEPYCLTCEDASADGGLLDGGDADVSDGGDMDAETDAGPVDSGLPDGCVEFELCNGHDDDCDGEIDEGFDLDNDVNHCGECGEICSPPHAFGVCSEGECGLGDCDPEWLNLDGELVNGCEYRCTPTHDDDSLCDLRDNDCDGETDEDVAFDTDIQNCGSCGRVCAFSHASATCVDGACQLDACEDGFSNIDGRTNNGCEYACVPADPADEVCNLADDDCDGEIDEGDPGGGEGCGIEEGLCSLGTTMCVGGSVQCVGGVQPTTELCNGEDDDCDGDADEGDPEGGRLCGSRVGTCEQGREVCSGGALMCVGELGPADEVCDGLDNDCDGVIDDGNPDGGGECGDDTGACTFGAFVCVRGALECMGGTLPTAELCNGVDDDCDGMVDEGNPEGGSLCGTDVGTCAPGTEVCMGGGLVCTGQSGPEEEVCDGLDNDCDGVVDDGNPGGGAACGDDTGACTFGSLVCTSGTLVCTGGDGPSAELCNTLDDDCDGMVDETFDLTRDNNNCGACGRVCNLADAYSVCSSGDCAVAACEPGFVDLDGVASNGCEYACSFAGAEVCNGADDDCDGMTDEGLTSPTNFCNPNGVCAGTVASCGASGWTCSYPATYQPDVEVACDGLDNDCDGSVDESYPLVGTFCTNGEIGACLRPGTYECNSSEDGVVCNAPASGGGSAEVCNGADDDCDGAVDEGMDPTIIPTVSVPRMGGGTVSIMRYEASRPDATDSSPGDLSTHACGNPDVVPWTTVTWPEARDACCALNASGTCSGDGSGWRLCDAADWETSCRGPADSCDWSYSSSCATSQPVVCNGQEYDCIASSPADDDCLFPTGDFAGCRTSWGGAGSVYDLSGNAKEWSNSAVGSGIYEMRGGSYSSIEAGRACDFDFTVAQQDFAHPNTGFRCCHY